MADELDDIVDDGTAADDATDDSTEDTNQTGEAEGSTDDSTGDSGEQTEDDRTVPLAALHEAREQNRELREQLNRQESRMNMIQERMDQAAQAQDDDETEDEIEIPDFADDPAGNINARFARMEQLLTRNQEQTATTAEQQQQSELQRQFDSAVAADQGEFMKEHPDYPAALAFERQRQIAMMTEGGLTEEQAQQAVMQSEIQMAQIVLHNKKSPAEVMYNAAVRAGYKADSTESTGETEDETHDKDDADSMGGGGAPSVQELLDADEDEFDKMFQDLGYGKKMQ